MMQCVREQTDTWKSIQQWTLWPEQELHEQIRPMLQFGTPLRPPLAGETLYPPYSETHRTSTGACHLFMDVKSGWVG